jgi:CubicO group peptidase (beta-lactamase class C family)
MRGMNPQKSIRFALAVLCFVVAFTAWHELAAAQGVNTRVPENKVDAVFSKWTASTPGCSVAATVDGQTVLQKAYGMADLEHDVRNLPDTIFEAGSVSKQFTAAAVLLLAKAGKLSLDDPVRKYVPELPEYGSPLLIRHMLNHTSGLRDWGSVEGIVGWPRTSRAYTHDHVVDIVSRQTHLNFTPGTNWSYSNTGFNLAAIIVSRVSGESFAEFSRKNIFAPLGMTHTSWRDDYTRVLKNRAIAYSETGGEYHTNMPFENIHGNGGLLTTVGDLMRWNENFVEPRIGDTEFVRLQQTPGKFNDGKSHEYGLGLYIGEYKGLKEVSHSGSTAGYRAFLTRFPDQHVSVAVLCNASTGQAEQYAHAIADLYLEPSLKPAAPPRTVTLTAADMDSRAGLYRNLTTGEPMTITRDKDVLRLQNVQMQPLSNTRFALNNGRSLEFDARGGVRLNNRNGTVESYERVQPANPSAPQLAAYSGTYTSDEAELTLKVGVRDGALEISRRPNSTFRLAPVYEDTFNAPGLGLIRFYRSATGQVTEFSVVQDRVWDLRFKK